MSDYILELKGITKIFPGVKALNNVQFQLKRGEVHALMGENGAGKSTFIKVITGVHKAEEGEMFLEGQKVDFKGPRDAQAAGIAAVYQHPTSYPDLTVAENIFMGHEIVKSGIIQWREMNKQATDLLKQLDADFKSTDEMGALSVAQQQMVEIAKALSTNAKIIILDEPTAALTKNESEKLYRIVDKLKEEGVSIIFISHRFEDMYRLASRVTVLRDSQYIGTYQVDGITNADLIKAMVGREISDLFPKPEVKLGDEVLRVEGMSRIGYFKNVSFSVRAGEIVGLTGLVGAGRTEVVESICGITKPDAGRIFLEGKQIRVKNPADAMKKGIVTSTPLLFLIAVGVGALCGLLIGVIIAYGRVFLDTLLQAYTACHQLLPAQAKDLYYRLFTVLKTCRQKMKLSSDTSLIRGSIMQEVEDAFNLEELHGILCRKTDQFFRDLENSAQEDATIFLIKDYIGKHYSEEQLSIKDISDHVFLSTSYVCTYFKSQTGQTLNQYLTEYRMERAMQLLQDIRYQITDISAKVGYSNGNYFGKSFKKFTGLTLSHLVIVLIPMVVVGVFFYARLYDMIVTSTIRNEQELAAQTVPLIENVIDDVRDSHSSLEESAFYEAITDRERSQPFTELAISTDAQDFYGMVWDYTSKDALSSVRIYIDCPQEEIANDKGRKTSILQPLSNVRGTYWYGIFQGSPSTSSLLCPSFYLGNYEIENYGDLAYITKGTVTRNGQTCSCYLATYFSNDYITELLTNNIRTSDNAAYIINSRDNLVATTSPSMSGTYSFSADEIQDNIMSSNTFITKKVLGETIYAGFYHIESTDWYMVLVMPAAPMLKHSCQLILSFILIYLAFLCLAFLIATKLSQSMTRRLSLVIDQMEKVKVAPPVELPAADSRDEIGELIDTYNYMSRKITNLMADQARTTENLRIAEFDSLQAQINPHFLYNTMEMISWLAQQGRTDEVTETVRRLSRFYRLTLSHKKGLTTIAEELEHVTIYVELQNMRFNNMLDFLVDVPDQLLEYGIPKLIFQPIVENSILHGILEKEVKEGSIVLTGWMEEEDIVLLISDDGVGMDAATLATLLTDKPHSSDRQGSNVAVYNTHRRLQILYGETYGLTYKSSPGEGTEVLIRIPAILPLPSQITEKVAEIPFPTPSSASDPGPDQEGRAGHTLLDYAPSLLANPRLNMHNIAFSCGYSDIQLFYQDFAKRYGFTPEEYRLHIL